MAEVFANSEDPDQTLHSAASDLGLHCLPNTLSGVSRLQWVKVRLTQFSPLECLVKILADNILKYFFFIFPRK